jgi:hypothetical protein
VVVVWVAFVSYLTGLVFIAHWIGQTVFQGLLARLAMMAAIACGLLPWAHWLRPRLQRLMGALGTIVLVVGYFTVLAPFALLVIFLPDPLRIRRPATRSNWVVRKPLPRTLEAAQLEW